MLSLDALYTGTLAATSRATDHLGLLGSLADRLADRVLPQAVAKAGCKCPRLCRSWIQCDGGCSGNWRSCAWFCEGPSDTVCDRSCSCTSSPCTPPDPC